MISQPQSAPPSDPKILVALDYDNQADCMALVERLTPGTCRLKIGKELFTTCGPAIVEAVQKRGFEVFLDLKFHDIPATVAKAVKAAANLGVWMVNVHASGGEKMLTESASVLAGFSVPPLLIGVTVLTSMSEHELAKTGVTRSLDEQVQYLAELTRQCGLNGVVCSAREAGTLKAQLGQEFKLVTPGIRPQGASLDDQHRVMTPVQAVRAGSDYLVIGRPITQAQDPALVCEQIHQELVAL